MNGRMQAGLFLFWLCGTASLFGEDWPQWLGPRGDSIWRETGIVEKFPTNGPVVLWRAPVFGGYSGPSVAKGRVYVTDRHTQSGEVPHERVLCLSESDGKQLWKHEYECPSTISYTAGPRVMPLVNDGKVFTLGAEGNLCCLDATSGDLVWSHDLKKELPTRAPTWGFAGHPLLDGERLICLAGGAGSTVVAFDKNSGKELWRALTAGEPGYSSPIMVDSGGKRQVIICHADGANSLDPNTGRVYWSVPFKANMGLTVATPRRLGDLLFFTSFYDGSLMLRLDQSTPAATEVWRSPKGNERDTVHLNSIICTPFLEEDYIYGVCSYGQLRCLRASTGERIWETFKATTSGQAVRWANAFIVKNGSRFFLFNEKGDLIIARLSPEGYEELSRAHLVEPLNKDCGRPVVWSHPAFANRRFYARNDAELVCVDLAAKP